MISNYPLSHLRISSGTLHAIVEYLEERLNGSDQFYFMPLNLTKYALSKTDLKLQNAIMAADLILPDGISIVWLSRRAGHKDVYRVSGIDFAEAIILRAKEQGWRLFFLGASPDNLGLAIDKINEKFGNINLVGYHHGYFLQENLDGIIDQISASRTDILFLGLGLPQKEYFIHDYFQKTAAKFCLPVGGAFDVWAGVKKRTPEIIQMVGLEWLYRTFYDKSRAHCVMRNGLTFLKDLVFYRK